MRPPSVAPAAVARQRAGPLLAREGGHPEGKLSKLSWLLLLVPLLAIAPLLLATARVGPLAGSSLTSRSSPASRSRCAAASAKRQGAAIAAELRAGPTAWRGGGYTVSRLSRTRSVGMSSVHRSGCVDP